MGSVCSTSNSNSDSEDSMEYATAIGEGQRHQKGEHVDLHPEKDKRSAGQHHFYWGYDEKNGPAHWAEHFPAAKNGKQQSPVDIPVNEVTVSATDGDHPLTICYKRSNCVVFNNEHTVEWRLESGGHVVYKEKKYELIQFHFHRPSEHTFSGKPKDIEIHFVHKNDKTDELLVLGHLYQEGPSDAFISNITQLDPPCFGAEIELQYKIETDTVGAKGKTYIHYDGSLTTPPCSEGVLWFVNKEVKTLSKRQLEWFKTSIPFFNARPLCPLHDRTFCTRTEQGASVAGARKTR